MAKNMILAMIREKCREDKISQKQLCKGICDPAYLSRCIKDNIEMDKLMMDALMQRLGISTRKYSHILNNSEYEFFQLRESIRNAIKEKSVNLISSLIQQYIERLSPLRTGKKMHMQVALFFCSYELELENADYEKQLNNIKYALECTGITTEALDDPMALFSEVELILLFRYAMLLEQKGEVQVAGEVYEKLCLLCGRPPYNNGELVHIFAAVAYHLSYIYIQKGKYEQVMDIARKMLYQLSEMNKFLFSREFMELYSISEKECGIRDEAYEYCHFFELINVIMDEYYPEWNPNNYCPMFYERNIYSLKRLVRERRELRQLTREDLAKIGYCNVATIERLERGIGDVQGDIGYQLLNALGLPVEKCFFYIVTENYRMRKLFYRVDIELTAGKVELAKQYLERVKAGIDMSMAVNRQYIEYREFCIDNMDVELSAQEWINKVRSLLEITLPLDFFEKDCSGMLYGNEEALVESIATSYEKNQMAEKGIEILRKVIKNYEGTEHVSNYLAFSRKLESMLANIDEFTESDTIIEEGLKKAVNYDFVGLLIPFLYDKVWNKGEHTQEITIKDLQILECAKVLSLYTNDVYAVELIIELIDRVKKWCT